MENDKNELAFLKLPVTWKYEESGGYDCLSDSYYIEDAEGNLILSIDVNDIEKDRISGHDFGESSKSESLAKLIVKSLNNTEKQAVTAVTAAIQASEEFKN